MTTLYFYSSSLYTSSFTIAVDGIFYEDTTLTITASAYETSGSTFNSTIGDLKAYIKSGSNVLASFPADQISIIYTNRYYPDVRPTVSYPYNSVIYYNFDVKGNTITASASQLSQSYYSFYSGSQTYFSGSFGINSSTNISVTYPNVNDYFMGTLIVSGSGSYEALLYVKDRTYNTIIFTGSSANYPLSYSLFLTRSFAEYEVTYSLTYNLPKLELKWNSVGNIPVSPTNSLSGWNSYLSSSASSVYNSGSFVSLMGSGLATQSAIIITSPHLTSLSSSGLFYLQTQSLSSNSSGSLNSFPNINSNPYLSYLDVSNNKISSSISDILPTGTGSSLIKYFNCSNNSITGSIPALDGNVVLEYFDCSNNKLSGSISSSLGNNEYLTHFDCSYNALTGSLPELSSSYNLKSFYCQSNNLSGSIPTLSTANYNLTHFDCSSNKLTGSIPELSSSVQLTYFDCSNNKLSGSIPTLPINFNSTNSLTEFYCSYNALTGSIPNLLYNNSLTTFYCNNNSLTTYTSASGTESFIPSSLLDFNVSNNQLTSESIDGILRDFVYSGITTPVTLSLSGSGNASPSLGGYTYYASLVNEGWNVEIKPLVSHSINIITGSGNGYASTFLTSITNIGQTFKMFENGLLQSASVHLGKVGNPIFDIQLNLYDQLNGLPNNLLATSLNTVSASSLLNITTGSYINFTFNNYYLTGSVSATGSYVIGITYSNTVTHNSGSEIGWTIYNPGNYTYGYIVRADASTPNNWTSDVSIDTKSIITYLV